MAHKVLDSSIVKGIHKIENVLLAVSLGLSLILTLLNVFLRYVLKTGLLWSEEFIGLNLLFIGVFGSAVGIRERGHTCMDNIVSRLPRRLQTCIYVLVQAGIIGVLLAFMYSGVLFTISVGYQKSFVLKWPMRLFYGLIPLGFLLCLVEELLIFARDIVNRECRFKTIEEQYLEEDGGS